MVMVVVDLLILHMDPSPSNLTVDVAYVALTAHRKATAFMVGVIPESLAVESAP